MPSGPPCLAIPGRVVAPKIPKKVEVNIPTESLKAFFWDKLKDNEVKEGAIWSKIGKEDIKLDDIYIKKLEVLFGQKKDERKVVVVTDTKPKLISIID